MDFETLQQRLIEVLRIRVRSGELTERSLARLTGVSQPHIHNVLKGVRVLSPEIADQILHHLGLTLLDLLGRDELAKVLGALQDQSPRFAGVPILEGRLGPGYPFPTEVSLLERFPFPAERVRTLGNPVVARVAEDSAMRGVFQGNDLVLLDQGQEGRLRIQAGGLYVVSFGSHAVIRRLRLGGSRLYLVTEETLHEPRCWEWEHLGGRSLLDSVLARVVWIGREICTAPDSD